MSEDGVFLRNGNIMVSSSLIQIGEQTFSTPNITSVRVAKPERIGRILGALVMGSIALACFSNGHWGWGAMWALFAGLCCIPPDGNLFLVTAGGESKALTADPARCELVKQAVIKAMQRSAATRT